MKNLNYFIITFLLSIVIYGQNCDELMELVKSDSYGTTYRSYDSDAIQKVTFYDITEDYQTYYFAIVCFNRDYYGCSEYIYQVSSSTESNYSMNYYDSAGKAFWKYIQPHNDNLDCAPNFDQ